jgi:hypothetical protein
MGGAVAGVLARLAPLRALGLDRLAPLRALGLALPLLAIAPQLAHATSVVVEARVRADLQSIVGEIIVTDAAGLRFVDALSRLPVPDDDVLLRRTFPFATEQGWVDIRERGPGRYAFVALLPRRYGASGMVPGHGLFANGLWHPQPTRAGAPVVVDWAVRLQLPPGTTGVLNGSVGEGTLDWAGTAERLSLAVVPGGRVTTLDTDTGRTRIVDHGPPRDRRDERLRSIVDTVWPLSSPVDLVIVEAPLRRRLVRSGPGVLFVSDRALRLSAGLWQFHIAALQRGVLEAALDIVEPWPRALAAAALAAARAPDTDLREQLGWVSWIPEVDSLLYDGRLPFYEDAFGEVWPPDPVPDDLAEVLIRSTPAQAITRRLDARYGEGTAERLAGALVGGAALADALPRVGVPADVVDSWRPWPEAQSLSVAVTPRDGGGAVVQVTRDAPPSVPGEPITLDVDGERIVWDAPAGPGVFIHDAAATPERVAVDPIGSVHQPTRSDDRWPRPLTMTAAFFPYELNLRGGGLSAAAWLSVRRQYSTRWRFDASVQTSPEDIIGGTVGAVRYLGPLQDRRNRPLRLSFGAGPSLLDPDFRPVADRAVSIDGYAGLAWDTRVDRLSPRRGHRLYVGGSGGVVPGQTAWSRVGGSGILILPIGGRIAVASRAGAAVASGDVAHRLLQLGGSGNVQGLRPDTAVGTARVTGVTELRWQALRHASIPMPLMWLSDLQLHGGVEAGALQATSDDCGATTDACWRSALGWSGGVLGTADVLGARPTSLGIWLAAPVWVSDDTLESTERPLQVYLRLTQSF